MKWLKAELGEEIHDTLSTIYLIRHGATQLNHEECLRGWKDVDLNADGEKEAKETAKQFKDVPLARVYSSDFKRAVQTAEPLVDETDAELVVSEELRPINFGDWNGVELEKIEKDMEDLQEKWKEDQTVEAPNGECFEDFQTRCAGYFEKILSELEPKEEIAIVAHLRNCIYILAYILNDRKPLVGDEMSLLTNVTQDTCGISVIKYSKDQDKIQIHQQNTMELVEER